MARSAGGWLYYPRFHVVLAGLGGFAPDFHRGAENYAQTHQVRREGINLCRPRRLESVRRGESHEPETLVYAEVVGQAAAQVLSEVETPARMAPHYRLLVSTLRA